MATKKKPTKTKAPRAGAHLGAPDIEVSRREELGDVAAGLERVAQQLQKQRGLSGEAATVRTLLKRMLKAEYGPEYNEELEAGLLFGPRGRQTT